MIRYPAMFVLCCTALFAGCSAIEPNGASPLLAFDSRAAGYSGIAMTARELRRGERASLLEFRDLDPDAGTRLAKDLFRLRSAATLAARRGFSHFIILEQNADGSQFLVGLLQSAGAEPGAVFGADYAHLSAAGIVDVASTPPLDIP